MNMKKRIIILVISLIIITGVIIGVSYAFFSTGGTQETANTFQSGCLNITLADASSSISLTNTYPITDIEGLNTTSYDFTITNTCSTSANYEINLESLNEVANSLSADYIKVSLSSDTVGNVISILSSNTSTTTNIDNAYEAYNLYTGVLNASETKTYHLKLWIDYDATVEQAANKVYQSKINVIANPEIEVVDNLETTFTLSDKTLTANLTSNVTSATYCTTTDNICEPSTSANLSNNSYTTTLNVTSTTKQVATVLGNIDVTTSIQMVCTKLNGTSKVICSNPMELNITPDFRYTSEEADNNKDEYCYYNNLPVASLSHTKENCEIIYEINYQTSEASLYYDKTFETIVTDIGVGTWDGNSCTYNGNTVSDIDGEVIISEENCGDVYLVDGNYISMINKVGGGVYKETYGKTGIYEGQDDDGTTYYYRGNVTNNWIKFGTYANDIYYGYYSSTDSFYNTYSSLAECENASSYNVNCRVGISAGSDIYWRIIRINGDGTLRIIYNGANTETTGITTQLSIGGAFNSAFKDNAYVGYMYTLNEVHGTSIDSGIKTILDAWYQSNLASYADDIDTNAGFCNDRYPSTSSSSSNGSGGTSTTETYYAAYIRLVTNKAPSFKCQTTSDLFTASEASKGNKALTYPIGLITADEVAYAGGAYNINNTKYYLYTGRYYWTMSPHSFDDSVIIAGVYNVYSTGGYSSANVDWTEPGVRPVINLRADITISGSGTISDPYSLSGN